MAEKARKTFHAIHKEYLRNSPKEAIEKTKDWMETGDSIISAAFDVATGKHMVELSQRELAMKFLGSEGAVLEIKRAAISGFLTENEAHKLTKKLVEIVKTMENDFSDLWGRESILYDLWRTQNFLDKRHYLSFLNWFNNGKDMERSKQRTD